jgi:hypothetical protein
MTEPPAVDTGLIILGRDEFEGPNSADLDDAARQAFAAAAVSSQLTCRFLASCR